MLKQLGWGIQQWLGLFLRSECCLCQRTTSELLCPGCQTQMIRCQIAQPTWTQPTVLPLLAWGQYDGALRRAIAAFKYEHQPRLAQPLGHWMADAWNLGTGDWGTRNRGTGNRGTGNQVKAQGIGNGGTGNGHPFSKHFTVVPIPMHPAKQRQRGFNQAELLARYFCDRTRFSLEVNGLQRVRQTEAQFNLSVQQRQQNLDNAFSLGQKFLKRPPSAPVLLLDDIYTTGATALSAAQTLQQHGIQVQGIIVLAKTAPKERRKEKPILKQQKSKEKHDGFF